MPSKNKVEKVVSGEWCVIRYAMYCVSLQKIVSCYFALKNKRKERKKIMIWLGKIQYQQERPNSEKYYINIEGVVVGELDRDLDYCNRVKFYCDCNVEKISLFG
jgi:hypothetical protein